MALLKSKFVWDKINLLQYIQFPWRWLSVSSLFIAVLLTLSGSFIKKGCWRFTYNYILLLAILINAVYFKPEEYLDNANALYYSDPERIQNEMSGILPDYIPSQMADYETLKENNQSLDFVWLNKGEAEKVRRLSLFVDRGHEKLIGIELSEEALVNFKIAYFPGWRAELDGQAIDLTYDQSLGNLQAHIPKGDHKIALYFSEKTPARTAGNSLSALGLVISLLYFSPFLKKKDKKH